jgi:FMN-dependent NADH-azoreductase
LNVGESISRSTPPNSSFLPELDRKYIMANVLVLTSSAAGEASVSSQLVNGLIEDWRAADPKLVVMKRDLGRSPMQHLCAEGLPGLTGDVSTPAAAGTLVRSEAAITELKAADVLVIGSPMYNFGITTTLKSWFDHVLRAGATFNYTAEGPKGLLTAKRAIVVESRGGFYSSGPANAMDAQEPHLRAMLGLLGISDVTFVRAESLKVSPEKRAEAIANATAELRKLSPPMTAKAA